MIAAVEGTLVSRGANTVTVKAGPLSLQINVPGSIISKLGHAGSTVMLHTHFYVREDVIALYGFSTRQELALFEQLITVSGIGPKVALALLTALSADQIAAAIIGSNVDLLSQVPGIGKKTAARIILDLKGKLEKGWEGEVISTVTDSDSDALAALTGLGYSIREAAQALSAVPQTEGMSVEERVRQALQQLAKK
ncbi:MAG: Holliday junction branch migration protein RuvA [Dehalococcoidia bacterium]|nr:Holliday junction branch migration protein RuvA [Dehalococcoidia bacterium]